MPISGQKINSWVLQSLIRFMDPGTWLHGPISGQKIVKFAVTWWRKIRVGRLKHFSTFSKHFFSVNEAFTSNDLHCIVVLDTITCSPLGHSQATTFVVIREHVNLIFWNNSPAKYLYLVFTFQFFCS